MGDVGGQRRERGAGLFVRPGGSLSGGKWIDHEAGLALSYMPRLRGQRRSIGIGTRRRRDNTGPVPCLICGVRLLTIVSHIIRVHGWTPTDYRERWPGAVFMSIRPPGRPRTWPNSTCTICGATYYRRLSHRPRYCSPKCSAEAARRSGAMRRVEYTCLRCGRSRVASIVHARRRKYCSIKCAARSRCGWPPEENP